MSRRTRLAALAGRLEALSPLAVLGRGYALVRHDGAVVYAIAFSPNGRYLATGDYLGRINLNTNWDAQLGTRVYPVADRLLPIRRNVDGGFYYYENGVALDRIPYTNRLFTNAALGRDTNSLMMMVTPRIIINEE